MYPLLCKRWVARSFREIVIDGVKWKQKKYDIIGSWSTVFLPALAAKALPVVMSMQDYEDLKRLHRQLLRADDEKSALLVLDLPDEL